MSGTVSRDRACADLPTRTGATGYVGGDVLHLLQSAHPEYQISTLVRGSENAAVVSKAYPKVRVVTGDLDNASLIEEEARQADVVIREYEERNETGVLD